MRMAQSEEQMFAQGASDPTRSTVPSKQKRT